jgi:16S rRNA processing protein RimM
MSCRHPERVCVAAVAGAYGVRGEARIKSFTADPAAFAAYGPLQTEDGARRFDVRLGKPVSGGFSARLSGVRTREDAEALKGVRLYAPRERLPALPDDEFYHADLIGLAAADVGGAPVGVVRAVENYGAGDFLEIAAPDGRSLLLPFTRDVVPTVDLATGRVVVDPPAEIVAQPGGSGEDD